jgi:phospholipid-binding lipoprotein MlaA
MMRGDGTKRLLPAALVFLSLTVAGCAGTGGDPKDPIEGFNRGVFAFNQAADKAVIRPIAWTYREGVPAIVKDRVRDFLNNLKTPVILANDLMQGEWARAETTFRRFFINTIAGVGGLMDVATQVGIPRHTEDFGQTLAVAGVADGPYIVLPFLGPSNPRDAVGLVVDYFLDPVRFYLVNNDLETLSYVRTGVDIVDTRARLITTTDDLQRNSVDYYATLRTIYRQRRETEIRNGAAPKATEGGEPAYPGQVIGK